jgi:hypothetical protein
MATREGRVMFSAGIVKSQALLQEALAEGGAIREREREARERSRRRLQAADAAALQAQVDALRVYVTALFQLLVARGVFTAEEAKGLVADLEAAEAVGTTRDVVTGTDLPPEENPFVGLAEEAGDWRGGTRRGRVFRLVVLVGLTALAACGLVGALWAGLRWL